MVAMHPGEGPRRLQRIETTHVDARLDEAAPESSRCLTEAAHPIVNHADANSIARLGLQGGGKLGADRIVANNVVLEIHPAFGALYRG
jgi:hypothetical protein